MITLYYQVDKQLVNESIDDASFVGAPEQSWIHLQNPTHETLEKIASVTGLSMEYLASALDEEETAHIETDEDIDLTFIVLDTPYVTNPEDSVYATAPFIIAYNTKYFVTIANHNFELIPEVIKKVKKIEPHKHVRLSTNFLYRLMTLFIASLKKIDQKTKAVEMKLHSSMRNKELFELMQINKTLVFFSTALNSNRGVLLKLFAIC